MDTRTAVNSNSARPSLYIYRPSVPLAIIGALLFTFVTIWHFWIFFRRKTWLLWSLLIGALMETAGYWARVISTRNQDDPYSFVLSYLALVLAPTFIAAACYVTFGRITWLVTPTKDRNFRTLWFPPRFLTPLFVAFDLGSFLIQLLGAGVLGSAYSDKSLSDKEKSNKIKKGLGTLRVGLVLQLICFSAFAIIGVRFLVLGRRWVRQPVRYGDPKAKWQRLNWTVNISATIIMLRAIYRMLEFSRGHDKPGYLQSREWPFWILDALPTLLVFIGFAIFHPVSYLPHDFLSARLDKRRLQQKEQSCPPTYNQSEAIGMHGYA